MNKKLFFLTVFLFIIVICYTFTLIPNKSYSYEYINSLKTIYTIDRDYYVSETSVYSDKSGIEGLKDLLDIMTHDSNSSKLLKNGFLPILPKGTRILDIKIVGDILRINFSKEFLDIDENLSEKMIESIIYTSFANSNILGVEIYVEGELLKYVPKTTITLPIMLTKDYGINKTYDLDSYDDINKVLVWFVKEFDDELYYVPVTKYVNDDNKIEIILEALTSKSLYKDNLMSFVNSSTKLVDYSLNEKELTLCFDDKISNDPLYIDSVALNEIVMSIFDNLDVNGVKLLVNGMLIKDIKR